MSELDCGYRLFGKYPKAVMVCVIQYLKILPNGNPIHKLRYLCILPSYNSQQQRTVKSYTLGGFASGLFAGVDYPTGFR